MRIFLSVIFSTLFFFFYKTDFVFKKEIGKHALLVAVSDYPEKSGWASINGENDILLIKNALLLRGFEEQNIHILKGKAATKNNILVAFQDISEDLKKGDFFIFHFSGHGQQVEDVGPVQDEVDGFDEALIPYDAPLKTEEDNYFGQRHLIDDEMEGALSSIRKKIGAEGQALLLIDACHSGSMTRVDKKPRSDFSRGTNIKLKIKKSNSAKTITNIEKENTGFFEVKEGTEELGNLILISASRPGEVNREYFENGKFYGPLSYAFAKVFPKMKKGTNYQVFFENLKSEVLSITGHQVPTIDGELDLVLGRNQLEPVHEYFTVLRIFDAAYLEVDAGQLLNFYEGTEFAFYPICNDTAGHMIAKGVVTETTLFAATVKYELLKEGTIEDLKRAYIIRQDFGDIKIRVMLDLEDLSLAEKLITKIAKIEEIDIVDQSPDLLIQKRNDIIEIIAEGKVIKHLEANRFEENKLRTIIIEESVLKYAQTKFLSELDIKNQDYRFDARIVPVNIKMDKEGNVIQWEYIPSGEFVLNQQGLLELPLGSFYQIEISNVGKKAAYLSILDIQPDGQFIIAVPFPLVIDGHKHKAEDYFFQAGDKKILEGHFWGIGRPVGIEQYSIIATDQPLDLERIKQTRGTAKFNNPFEELFKKSFNVFNQNNKTRKGRIPPIIPSSINIQKVFVEITE
jgi:hypothetical protein